jgi:hypothetical protein
MKKIARFRLTRFVPQENEENRAVQADPFCSRFVPALNASCACFAHFS